MLWTDANVERLLSAMFSRWKLALKTSANFVATRDSSASFRQVCHGH